MVSETQGKGETSSGSKQPQGSSTPSGRKWFKCQGLGHIVSSCPNKSVIVFVKEEEEHEEEKLVYNHHEENDGECAYTDQGMFIVKQRNLKVSCMVEGDN